ncbi:MAG: glycine--tRNA ligase subunit beta [Planctomycetes bacterium]|nr:glycine--tRNA ligase subunit beta [Planctomycetota bacterium]
MSELLYEIGAEEIPAGYLEPALEQLAGQIGSRLEEAGLPPQQIRTAGSPRRMTVAATGIPQGQPARRRRTVGPPAGVAFDEEGNPTPAAEGFARSQGVAVEELETVETEKGAYVAVSVEEPGMSAAELLPEILVEATVSISFPKSMRWEKSGLRFARPIRWLVALLDGEALPVAIAGVEAGRLTRGHPFLSGGEIELSDASFERYRDALAANGVIVDIDERREAIRSQINDLLEYDGAELRDERLLREVTNLVEHPRAIKGRFDEKFLRIPEAVLVAAMKGHQRYFPVRGADGRLLPFFITVSNGGTAQDDLVRRGNERVLRARLEDAAFYWDEDRKITLEERVPRLAGVVFLGGLGDNLQRTERLVELGEQVAAQIGDERTAEHVRRAAHLCKADLLSGLVGEFPDLQGVVGRELALQEGEPEEVATAIREHYLAAGAEDALPSSLEGAALALADKMDVIVGCFSLGLLPGGSRDPYALRRSALGILLIIEERGLELRLGGLIEMARRVAARQGIECGDECADLIRDFFRDRLYRAALERGLPHDFVRAVQAAGCDDVRGFWGRLAALEECSNREWWPQLVELVDRTFRIQRDVESIPPVRDDLLREPLEKELAAQFERCRGPVGRLLDAGRYVQAAEQYCDALAGPVHEFFEQVFVNVEDEQVRLNRKSLCGHVYRLFAERFADLYLIETTGSS